MLSPPPPVGVATIHIRSVGIAVSVGPIGVGAIGIGAIGIGICIRPVIRIAPVSPAPVDVLLDV